jgi:hypothetical protein
MACAALDSGSREARKFSGVRIRPKADARGDYNAPYMVSVGTNGEGVMTLDPLFFAGLAIAFGGFSLGILMIIKTKRWVEKQ